MRQIGLLEAIEAYEKTSEYLDIKMFLLSLAASLCAAAINIALYRAFYESRGTGSQIHRSFIQLSLAITTLFLCIQISIPLSLGLLGSLSIIRFRTPIKEPEEVGSIMLVIASSISAATFHFAFMFTMLAVAAASLFVASRLRGMKFLKRDGLMTVAFPDSEASRLQALSAVLPAHFSRCRVLSSASAAGATTVQYSFAGLKTDVCAVQAAVREAIPSASAVNVFLDRPGGFR